MSKEQGHIYTKLDSVALKHYKNSQPPIFPLIASVLEGRQPGTVMKDSETDPGHFFVINKFGFCHEFYTKYNKHFFEEIKKMLSERQYNKLRFYSPVAATAEFLSKVDFALKAERIQFKYTGGPRDEMKVKNSVTIRDMTDLKDLQGGDLGLDLTSRYWNSADDFFSKAQPVGAFLENKLVGITYAAGIGLNKAEFDTAVTDECRGAGVGSVLIDACSQRCLKNGLIPNVDIYSNNLASVRMVEKAGFVVDTVYDFYNITGND